MYYKILQSDFSSVREEDRVCYLSDPATLPGPWIEVPGKGAYVSRNGEGLFCGGVPKNWRCVRLEAANEPCEQAYAPTPAPGVQCFHQVRVVEILESLPAATQTGAIWVYEGARLTLPAATQTGAIEVYEGARLTLPAATQTGAIWVYKGASLTLPAATQTGDIWVHAGARLTLPAATQTGDIWVHAGAGLTRI